MNSKLEALISAYTSNPKKSQKKTQKRPGKLVTSETSNKLNSRRAIMNKNFKHSVQRENQSVKPKRSESTFSLTRFLNNSFDEDMERLELLTHKNSSISTDWMSAKQRMLELKVLDPIIERDESDRLNSIGVVNPDKQVSFNLIKNYDSLMNLKVKKSAKVQ